MDDGGHDVEIGAFVVNAGGQFVVRPEQGGYYAAANSGIAAARYSAYVLLNTDAAVLPGCLERLKLAWWKGLPFLAADVFCGTYGPATVHEVLALLHARPVEPVPGALTGYPCSLIDRRLWEACGPFDEAYRRSAGDTDFAFKAARLGCPPLIVRDAVVVHPGRDTVSRVYTEDEEKAVMAEDHALLAVRWRDHPELLRPHGLAT